LDVGRIGELIERLAADGAGVTITPVKEGDLMGGLGSQHTYAFDGWEVGYITASGGGELAVGKTVAEAVEAAIDNL
jgi:hypothetical protein